MFKFKRIFTAGALLTISSCASFGPTVLIETPEPAEDFVVLCEWHSSAFAIHGGAKRNNHKVFVAESGKEVDCGVSMSGGSGNARIMHPLYHGGDSVERDGVRIVRPKPKLQVLDELKENFEKGVYDSFQNPGSRYADSLKGICWFPYKYFEYYKEVDSVEYAYFKTKYYEPILSCYERVVPILKKYDKSYKNIPVADEYVKEFWNPGKWEQFK